jgi:hypothetical protein
MPNYKNGKIYKLVCFTTGKVYIGSTTQSLAKRKGSHVEKFKKWKIDQFGYTTSFEIIQNDNFRIELIENYPCESKEALFAREGALQRSIECVNKNIAGRSNKQRYEDNIESITANQKEYYSENKEKVLARVLSYRTKNSESIKQKNPLNLFVIVDQN